VYHASQGFGWFSSYKAKSFALFFPAEKPVNHPTGYTKRVNAFALALFFLLYRESNPCVPCQPKLWLVPFLQNKIFCFVFSCRKTGRSSCGQHIYITNNCK